VHFAAFPYLDVTNISIRQPCLNFAIYSSHMFPRQLHWLDVLLICICVAIVSHAQECRHLLRLMHVRWTMLCAFSSAGTSWNKIESTNVESESQVGEASGTVQLVSYRMKHLSANASWDCHLCEKSATTFISVSNSSNLHSTIFLQEQPM